MIPTDLADHDRPIYVITITEMLTRARLLRPEPRPIPDFPCLTPLIDETRDVIRLIAGRHTLVPRRR